MSEQPEQPVEGEPQEPQEGTEEQPETFDAEYVAKLRKEAAKHRTEAKKNAEAAKELEQIKAADKSEAEKSADRISELESELQSTRQESLRFKVASTHGIGQEDAELFLTGSDEETLTKQAERLASREDERKQHGNRVPQEGNIPKPRPDERREFADFLTGH